MGFDGCTRQHRLLAAQPRLSKSHRGESIPMKLATMYAAALGVLASNAYAVGVYEDYDPFYAAQPHAVFAAPIKFDAGVLHSIRGEPGVFTELQSRLDGRSLRIW